MEAQTGQPSIEQPFLPDKKLLAAATCFGILFSLLVVKQEIGLNFFIVVLAVYAMGILTLSDWCNKSFKDNAYAYLFTIPVLFLSATFFIFSNEFIPLNFFIVLLLVWAQYLMFTGKNLHAWYDIRFGLDLFMSFIMRIFGCCYRYFQTLFGLFAKNGEQKPSSSFLKVLLGIAIGFAALLIILPLLMSADDHMSSEIQKIFSNLNFGDSFLYFFFFLVAACFGFGFIWSLKNDKPGIYSTQVKQFEKQPFNIVSILSAYTVVVVVYIFFAALQFKYLFSNYNTLMNTPNLTNSQYAVRGFAELIFITLLNFAFLALSIKFTRPEGKGKTAYLKLLYLILIVFNFIILFSSHMRLSLYEHSFGFTLNRFVPHLSLILFAMLNVVMMVKIFKPQMRALKYMILIFLVLYTALNFMNPDRMVAQLNINRYYEKSQNAQAIDEDYLLTLSDDAIPVVAAFMEKEQGNADLFEIYVDPEDAAKYPGAVTNDKESEDSNVLERSDNAILIDTYNGISSKIDYLKKANSRWQSFNISRSSAQAAWEKINSILLEKTPKYILTERQYDSDSGD